MAAWKKIWIVLMMLIAPATAAAQAAAGNPFFEDWSRLPYGAPPFARIETAHILPAIEAGIEQHEAEIAAIAARRGRATFSNTIEALERSGRTLTQATRYYNNLTSADNTPELQAVQREAGPLLARHASAVYLNQGLWARVRDLYARRDSLRLTPEQARLLWRYHLNFVRAGAALEPSQRERLAAIDEELARLSTTFGQNLLADTAAWTLRLDGERDLAGLSASQRAAALQAGRERGMEGAYLITLQRSSVEPFLTYSSRRDLRARAFQAWGARGQNGNEWDNRAIIRQMLALRLEKARLLGYESFADYILDDRVAKTPEAAYQLMMAVWAPAVARAGEERAAMQALIDAEGGGFALEAWDWRYYAERVRAAQYDLNEEEIRPYLQLDNILNGAFHTANRLFGLNFVRLPDFAAYHPDVATYEVRDRRGRVIGLYLCDPFARPTKQSGAWMNSFVVQQRLGGRRIPVISNNWNYNKPEAGAPTLLSWDDAETVFHEFGHALHGLLSNVTYPSLAGTAVPRDYVEFPSQVMEHWLATDDMLSSFAVNAEGEAMPEALRARIRAAEHHNKGFATVELLASAIVDMDMHRLRDVPANFDISAFEAASLARIGMPREIIMRHRSPHFTHLFMNTYHAGYYGYLWAEVMDADAFEAFAETGDMFDPATAERFARFILSTGNSADPMENYIRFRGRLPQTAALLRQRGFPVPSD